MTDTTNDVKFTISDIMLARTVLNIAFGRAMNTTIGSSDELVKLEKIQKQIKEHALGRDLALAVESYLCSLGCRQYGKNLRFDVSYRSDISTLSISHVGVYIDEDEGEENFEVSYAQETTQHVTAPSSDLAVTRNLTNGSLVLNDGMKNRLSKWLCCSITLPDGKKVRTIESRHFSIQFFGKREDL